MSASCVAFSHSRGAAELAMIKSCLPPTRRHGKHQANQLGRIREASVEEMGNIMSALRERSTAVDGARASAIVDRTLG
jgi:uncharacterized protein YqeY